MLKATIDRSQVTLGVMEGPETSAGPANFVPSWMYWQKLPRRWERKAHSFHSEPTPYDIIILLFHSLQFPKTVILHRRERASWGFSIVGGAGDATSNGVGGRVGGGGGDGGGGGGGGEVRRFASEPIHVLFVVPDSPAAKDAKIKWVKP